MQCLRLQYAMMENRCVIETIFAHWLVIVYDIFARARRVLSACFDFCGTGRVCE